MRNLDSINPNTQSASNKSLPKGNFFISKPEKEAPVISENISTASMPDRQNQRNPASTRLSLLGSSPYSKPAKKRRNILKLTLIAVILVILLLGGMVVIKATNISNKIFVGQKMTFFQKIKDVLRGGGGEIRLKGEDLGQINILLLGIGGEGHDGPYLSDTIILAQIRPDTGQIALTSIPRDYWAQLPGNLGSAKINSAFALGFAKSKNWDEAGYYARQAVENVSGLKIPYFAVVDFAGFEDAINEIGGVDVNVERSFTDYTFPDEKEGFLPAVSFEKGAQHLDGIRALQFARSRHAEGPEGSDFARSQRQQKIIDAFKSKILGLNIITNASKINGLLSIFADHFHTNISPGEIFRLYNLTKEKNIQEFLSVSLDPSTSLVCPKIMENTGAYVLLPCAEKTENDIKNFFKNIFSVGRVFKEKSVVWMAQSAGGQTDAYKKAGQKLTDAGLTVWELPYSGTLMPYNVYYMVNYKPATAEFIKNTLNATEVSLPPPDVKIDKDKVDAIIILGGNN